MKQALTFEARRPIQAEPARVLDTLRQALLSQGALVKQLGDQELHVVCRATRMGRSPFVGVSEAEVRISGSTLEFRAELGGVRRVRRFALLLPLSLGLGLTTIFGLIWWAPWRPVEAPWAPLVPLLATAPWIVIAPLMARALERTTRKALEDLVDSVASMR